MRIFCAFIQFIIWASFSQSTFGSFFLWSYLTGTTAFQRIHIERKLLVRFDVLHTTGWWRSSKGVIKQNSSCSLLAIRCTHVGNFYRKFGRFSYRGENAGIVLLPLIKLIDNPKSYYIILTWTTRGIAKSVRVFYEIYDFSYRCFCISQFHYVVACAIIGTIGEAITNKLHSTG